MSERSLFIRSADEVIFGGNLNGYMLCVQAIGGASPRFITAQMPPPVDYAITIVSHQTIGPLNRFC